MASGNPDGQPETHASGANLHQSGAEGDPSMAADPAGSHEQVPSAGGEEEYVAGYIPDAMVEALEAKGRECLAERLKTSKEDAAVAEKKKAVHTLLYSKLADYQHYQPADIEKCASTLATIVSNILNHSDEKYRTIKASKLEKKVLKIKGADEVMLAMGFRPKVKDFEKAFSYDLGAGASFERKVLTEVLPMLKLLAEEAHRRVVDVEKEQEGKLKNMEEAKRSVMLAIQDDRQQRQDKFVYQPPPQ